MLGLRGCSDQRDKKKKLLEPIISPKQQVEAYFSMTSHSDMRYFYKLNLAEEEDEGFNNTNRAPKPLEPFSKAILPIYSVLVGLGSCIYSIGGQQPIDAPSPLVYSYDTASPNNNPHDQLINGGWLRAPDLILPRVRPKAVVIDGIIFVMGGVLPYPLHLGSFYNGSTKKVREDVVCTIKANWAEFYDPKDPQGVWKPVKVRRFGDTHYEHPFPSLFSLLELPYDCLYGTRIEIWKFRGHRIFICAETGCSVYNVRTQTLKTISTTGHLFGNVHCFVELSHMIGDQVHDLSCRYLTVVAHDILDGYANEDLCTAISTSRDRRLSSGSPPYGDQESIVPITFNTDGVSDDDASSCIPIYFLWEDIEAPNDFRCSLLKLTAVTPSQGRSNGSVKSKYFRTPPGMLTGRGVLLHKT